MGGVPILGLNQAVRFSGVMSGIDTEKIIQKLAEVEQKRIDAVRQRGKEIQSVQGAVKTLEGKLWNMLASASALVAKGGEVFESKIVRSSQEEIVTGTASKESPIGHIDVLVEGLAAPHIVASQGFDSADARIPTGVIKIKVGSGPEKVIAIDATNNTLTGLAEEINSADAGVTAAVIRSRDRDSSVEYRLVLYGKKTGARAKIIVTNNLGEAGPGEVKPNFSDKIIGKPRKEVGFQGTAAIGSKEGPGGYFGTGSKTYLFTVTSGGVVGFDNGIVIAFRDDTGTQSGQITVNASDVDQFIDVAEGLKVKFGTGSLVTGDSFYVAVYDPEVQAARNARIKVGGENGLAVESEVNRFVNVLPGLTLEVKNTSNGRSVGLDVSYDDESVVKNVRNFVLAVNDASTFIVEQTAFEPENGIVGKLFGIEAINRLYNEIINALQKSVKSENGVTFRGREIGLQFGDNGSIVFDESNLRTLLSRLNTNQDRRALAKFFSVNGSSDHPGVAFIAASRLAVERQDGVGVRVIANADRARIGSAFALGDPVTVGTDNNRITVRVDGVLSEDLQLVPGTYTLGELANHIQYVINENLRARGADVKVFVDNGRLTIESERYGSVSSVETVSGSALGLLGFNAGQKDVGQDVVGYYMVDGMREEAAGFGQVLSGASGNIFTSGLQVKIAAGAATPLDATVKFQRGIAASVEKALWDWLDGEKGNLVHLNGNFEEQLKDLERSATEIEKEMELKKEVLLKKFAHMESVIARLKNGSDFLLANLLSPVKQLGT